MREVMITLLTRETSIYKVNMHTSSGVINLYILFFFEFPLVVYLDESLGKIYLQPVTRDRETKSVVTTSQTKTGIE